MQKSLIALCAVLLAGLTLFGAKAYAQADRGAGVPAEMLPENLKGLEIKDHFVSSVAKQVGVIHKMLGQAVVVHGDSGEAFFALAGDAVFQNDALTTLTDSRCRIRFFNEDIVTMAPQTVFSVDSYADEPEARTKSSLFSLVRGKAMFYAMRLFSYKETRFRVKTPTVTVGVRGTKFGAHVYWLEDGTARAGTQVADSGRQMGLYLAETGTGEGTSFTNCFCEDGFLDVDGRLVAPGEMYRGELGAVIPTPPEVQRDFDRALGIQPEPLPGEAVGPLDTGALAPQDYVDLLANVTDNINQETGNQTDSWGGPRPTFHEGYFTALLTGLGSRWLENIFVTRTDQDLDGSTAYAEGHAWPSNELVAGGHPSIYDDAYIRELIVGGVSSGSLGDNHPINDELVGWNRYQEWGYWTMTIPIMVSGTQYVIDNRGWYIHGETTEDHLVAGMKGEVGYHGGAYGTYWNGSGGVDLHGAFHCNVDFDASSTQIKDLYMHVSNPSGYGASISGAEGSFTGASNDFSIDTLTGTWTLRNPSATYSYPADPVRREAYGSLYGPNAEAIGGVWKLWHAPAGMGTNDGASGIFQGQR